MDINGVYLGVWTNWSRGSVLGPTLTLNREHGNYVIALTAFFIAFVATRFWRISCFLFHRWLSDPTSTNALHRQRQIILCNSSNPESAFMSLALLLWSWRRLGTRRHLYGVLLLIMFVVICISSFVVAGSFSSRISTDVGNEVLLRPTHCGFIHNSNTAAGNTLMTSYLHQRISTAMNYADQCYAKEPGSSMVECKRFIVPKLPSSVNNAAGCPFQGGLCRSNNSNLLLDTGYIDSREQLGLNTPDGQRFQQRQVLHCAPLTTEGYERRVTSHNQTIVTYNYGSMIGGSENNITLRDESTYQAEDIETQYRYNLASVWGKDFKLAAQVSRTIKGKPALEGGFMPKAELQRPDGDVQIIFLSGNGVVFNKRTADDWYRATVPYRRIQYASTGGYDQGYRPDIAASPLGCVQQWQWCNPSLPKDEACGPLASELDAYTAAAPLFNITDGELGAENKDRGSSRNPRGSALIWGSLIEGYRPSVLYELLSQTRSRALSSSDRLFGSIAMELAEDQWKLDVTKWWNTLQAAQQASYVDTVRGPVDPGFDALRYSPISDYEKTLCANQKVLSTAHTSFSVFGLYFTFITGGLIILVSYLLDPIVSCLHTRYRRKSYKYLEWTSNTYLQIHRQAEEQFGLGTWQGCTSTIPTINPSNAVLASLDISDLKHPKLRRPSMPVSGLDLDDLCDGGEGGDVGSPSSVDNTPTGSEVKSVTYETQVHNLHGSDVSPTCTEVSTSNSEVRLSVCADTDDGTFHNQAAPRIGASVNRA